jgi:hypothetical protein
MIYLCLLAHEGRLLATPWEREGGGLCYDFILCGERLSKILQVKKIYLVYNHVNIKYSNNVI